MNFKYSIVVLLFLLLMFNQNIKAQEEEPILYFQMEALDDSLFVRIQEEVYIDPPDPKAEIIVDVRDQNNQTITIKRVLYPFLAFSPEVRARIIAYPFKIDLQEQITLTSVFTRVVEKMRFTKMFEPPRKNRVISTLHYINPYLQLLGGERFGVSLKDDVGLSFGIGTPYSGPLETNFVEANFHILGAWIGIFNGVDAIIDIKESNNHNNIISGGGFQVGYVLPFGNFFGVSFQKVTVDVSDYRMAKLFESIDTNGHYRPKILEGSYFNWEFRYPFRTLGASRAKIYVSHYQNEWHIGFTGRELSLAGSTFDLRIDVMPSSSVRNPRYVFDLLVQRIFQSWGFSAFALGPSLILSNLDDESFGVTSIFLNLRLKVGTSL
jgi:hypothetical protein